MPIDVSNCHILQGSRWSSTISLPPTSTRIHTEYIYLHDIYAIKMWGVGYKTKDFMIGLLTKAKSLSFIASQWVDRSAFMVYVLILYEPLLMKICDYHSLNILCILPITMDLFIYHRRSTYRSIGQPKKTHCPARKLVLPCPAPLSEEREQTDITYVDRSPRPYRGG